ncbi:MAG: hypothetical protein HOM11_15720 [Methylococcales bacterium]|jgi:hypothetical protein|nr:hypothetical protein [Methylococcales bacterium]MBT7445025.1 hypothetical protein [Methylococcales bacterium]
MTVKRFFAIGFIYFLALIGWNILGDVTQYRSSDRLYGLHSDVESLWGKPITQSAPRLSTNTLDTQTAQYLSPSKNNINVDLILEYRKKGLIWFPTYKVRFNGEYQVTNNAPVTQKVKLAFDLPVENATYDHFQFTLEKQPINVNNVNEKGIRTIILLNPGETKTFNIDYATRGIKTWRYDVSGPTQQVNKLDLTLTTNVDKIDFTTGSLSPMTNTLNDSTRTINWQADRLLTQQPVAVEMPEKLNPGPLASRITYFAPICLGFFFIVLGSINIVKQVNIHPMHYFFVAGGFFAFHLLFAYMVDLVDIHIAFATSALVSLILVTSYLKAALGQHFPWKLAAFGQTLYLLLFSYSFFFEGATGIIVTIGSILTLAGLMYATAKIDWSAAFKQRHEDKMARKMAAKAAKLDAKKAAI